MHNILVKPDFNITTCDIKQILRVFFFLLFTSFSAHLKQNILFIKYNETQKCW